MFASIGAGAALWPLAQDLRTNVRANTSNIIIVFFFFFLYPLLLYHTSGPFVKYFSKTFFKKFSKFLLTFGSRCDIIILKKGGLGKKSSFWRGENVCSPPLTPHSYIIPQGAGFCQVFFENFFKKIKQKIIDFY